MKFRLLFHAFAACVVISGSCAQFASSESLSDLRTIATMASPVDNGTEINIMTNTVTATTKPAPLVESFLREGRLTEGHAALVQQLIVNKTDDQARFGLGVLEFLEGVQNLKQQLFHFGLRSFNERGALPAARMLVAANPNPALFRYKDARAMIESFQKSLLAAEHTLSLIQDPNVHLPLYFGMIKLNFKDETQKENSESLWNLYARLSNNQNVDLETAKKFYIKFDRGDVHWLRGYCHLLSAVCDVYLAYDTSALFEHTAHILFTRVETPYKFLSTGKRVSVRGAGDLNMFEVVDLVAFFHLIDCKLIEPKRMESALHHLEAVVDQSRISWKFIMAETDDDHEWLPNPRQTGVIPNMQVTDEMVKAWADLMDQFESLLKGEELFPFWRGTEGGGVNVRKFFLQPRDFDLVLWIQGTAAVPYIEQGLLAKDTSWRHAQSTFGAQFPGFAMYFN